MKYFILEIYLKFNNLNGLRDTRDDDFGDINYDDYSQRGIHGPDNSLSDGEWALIKIAVGVIALLVIYLLIYKYKENKKTRK